MPKPKTTNLVCDTCGLDWKQHKPNAKGTVPLTECVRLLKAELAKKPTIVYQGINSASAWPKSLDSDLGVTVTVHAVQGPELDPFHCLACHAHRCDRGWVSLDVDMLEGHAYLCGDCANAVTHASGGLTDDQRVGLEASVEAMRDEVCRLNDVLGREREEKLRVVPVEEIVPYVKKAPGRPPVAA